MITVIIPVLNEAATVASVVELARKAAGVTEVIVVDDGSIDGTPELARTSGARVIVSTLLGKGASMEDGLRAAHNENLVYLDGDLTEVSPEVISLLVDPLLRDEADFVKEAFSRRAGRVTVLTARPLLDTFFPELSHVRQPLGGMIAGRRSLLRTLPFETDYGVDIGLLLDASAAGARIAQVEIGSIEHSSQSLEVLGDMARQVARVILKRASAQGRLDAALIGEVEEIERHSRMELSLLLKPVRSAERLALLDMDGTLIEGRFAVRLASAVGRAERLGRFLDNHSLSPEKRTRQIGRVFRGIPRSVFEEVARDVPLRPGAVQLVVGLRKLGFRVGIVSDSFHIATEIVRRRIFAEFSIAHLMRFRAGIATGTVHLAPALYHQGGCRQHKLCKKNALLRLCEHFAIPPSSVLAAGDTARDVCMLEAAGL
ncbi:MAG TPA: HAD-IB family phosphatase, partial [Thermoanaerobaculia bacterium]|nr:HAD-IB family phosphatase [Thermoanaerobaculia bacterium]